jgi:nitrosocyanin
MGRHVVRGLAVAVVAAVILLSSHGQAQTASAMRTIALVNVEASGAKIWLPSAVVLHAGDHVTFKLDNKLDAPHGFSINEYGIAAIVGAKGTQEVTFTAKKGTTHFYCQLHPAHIGGEILVL